MLDHTIVMEAAVQNVRAALAEDVGSGDVSATLIESSTTAVAQVITRDEGVFCGRPWVEATIQAVDAGISLTWHVEDGQKLSCNDLLFTLEGPARYLLTAERTMLNFVQLFSGTATRTAQYVALLGDSNSRLLDTRKTIPGLRIGQKYAVQCGGGVNHRLGLYDAYLLKENHISAAGSITAAVSRARQARPDLDVEVEVESIEELEEAIRAGADIAMLDNFSLAETNYALQTAKGRILLEASGGIDEASITEIAATGVDYISIGDLTKTITPLDLSMRFTE